MNTNANNPNRMDINSYRPLSNNGMSNNSNENDLDLSEEHYWTWSGSTQEPQYPKLTSNLYKQPSYHKSSVIRNLLDPFGEAYSDHLYNPYLGKPGGKIKESKRSLQGLGIPTRDYSPPATIFSSQPGGFRRGVPHFNSAPGFVFYPSPPRKRKYYPSEAEEVKARSKKAGSVSGLSGVAAALLCCLGMPSRRHDDGAARRHKFNKS